MGCFLVSTAEAVIVTAVEKAEETREKNGTGQDKSVSVPFSAKLKWLTRMLWGGAILLAFEHVWHGEVTPWFPFLTAMADPADTAEMLHEMATIGVTMAVIVTVVWIGMCFAADAILKRAAQASENAG